MIDLTTFNLDPAHPEYQLAEVLNAQRTGTVYDLGTGEYSLPEAIRARYEEEVRGLGKFEGQAPHVPYYYVLSTHGWGGESECHCSEECDCDDGSCAACCADEYGCECDSHWETFAVSAEDVLIFPELTGRATVRIYFASSGFVSED